MQEIYLLALVISLASILSILFRKLDQPLIVSYLLTGAILSLFHIVRPEQLAFLRFLPDIGLAFLLFLVGMELDLREFKQLGKHVIWASVTQVFVSSVLLFFVLINFGLQAPAALVTAISLSFSSTILVVKLLLEHKQLSSLHGKLSVGILLLEDLLAILLLMFLAIVGEGKQFNLLALLAVIAKGAFLIWFSLFAGRKLLPALFKTTAENFELLVLTAIGWCLIFVSVSSLMGFSIGIGAFLAGISMAQSVYRGVISGKIKPLRDFFIMIFFIDLGIGLSFSQIKDFLPLSFFLLFYACVIKPVIFYFVFIWLRFRARTAFQSAIQLSSISEFALIILFLITKSGLINPNFASPLIFAAVFSFVFSSLLITYDRKIYHSFKPLLKKLERSKTFSIDFLPSPETQFSDHAVLVGVHHSGSIVLRSLQRFFENNLLAVDFNPDIISSLKDSGVSCVYGDIGDIDILDKLNLKEAKLVISTIRFLPDNLALLDSLEKIQSPAIVIVAAADSKDAVVLYERGAHHVSIPVNLEGTSISRLISDYHDNLRELRRDRERKLGELKRALQ